MFHPDIISLKEFYSAPMGKMVAAVLARVLRRIWPEGGGDALASLGYTLPLLEELGAGCSAVIPMMPASQGAMAWPPKGNRMALVHELSLPLRSQSVNRVLVLHTLEHSRAPGKLLEEVWRVLVPGGRALIVVPNRRSLWAQAATTPFGCGQPYTLQQIGKRLGAKRFTLLSYRTCLFTPPLNRSWLFTLAPLIEWLGTFLLSESGGVIVMEVEKQIYASIPEPVREEVEARLTLPLPGAARVLQRADLHR